MSFSLHVYRTPIKTQQEFLYSATYYKEFLYGATCLSLSEKVSVSANVFFVWIWKVSCHKRHTVLLFSLFSLNEDCSLCFHPAELIPPPTIASSSAAAAPGLCMRYKLFLFFFSCHTYTIEWCHLNLHRLRTKSARSCRCIAITENVFVLCKIVVLSTPSDYLQFVDFFVLTGQCTSLHK